MEILTEPKNALVRQYQRMFELDGVELDFEAPALEAIADLAVLRQTGARGLRAIMEEVLGPIMFEVPSTTTSPGSSSPGRRCSTTPRRPSCRTAASHREVGLAPQGGCSRLTRAAAPVHDRLRPSAQGVTPFGVAGSRCSGESGQIVVGAGAEDDLVPARHRGPTLLRAAVGRSARWPLAPDAACTGPGLVRRRARLDRQLRLRRIVGRGRRRGRVGRRVRLRGRQLRRRRPLPRARRVGDAAPRAGRRSRRATAGAHRRA